MLAADTVVACGRRILPKAATEAQARACLTLLSGRRHRVMTAVVLVAPDGRRAERLAESVVGFARLTGPQLSAYLDVPRMARQGRRLRHPGAGGGACALPLRQLFQRRRAAAVRDGEPAARPRLPSAVRLLAACSPGEVRVAAVDGSGLVDYAVWRPGAPDGVGDLHRGRVAVRVPAMAGTFVRLAGGVDGFLPDSEGGAGATEGQALGVRVARAAQGGKGPRLTARLDAAEAALVGAGPPALLRRGPGAVERLAALHPDAPVAVDDAAVAAALRPLLGERLRLVRAAFDDEVASQVAALAEPAAALPGGARMSVHPTPALVAIDVDLGAATGAGGGKARSQVAANRALLPALARQIRLRNLSGAILVDLGGVSVARRARLGPALQEALDADPLAPRLLGFTALGLAEILRPRRHPPLHDLLAGPHAAGLAGLRAADSALAAHPHLVPVLRVSPAVAEALRADEAALADWQRRTGRSFPVRTDPALPACTWSLDA